MSRHAQPSQLRPLALTDEYQGQAMAELPLEGKPSATTPLRFRYVFGDGAWTHDRDHRFEAFVADRIAHAEACGACSAELKLLAGVQDVLAEWREKRSHVGVQDDPAYQGAVLALGHALRMLAFSAWSQHPRWEADFHPAAVAPVGEGAA